jgi:hypothetical protein
VNCGRGLSFVADYGGGALTVLLGSLAVDLLCLASLI